MGVLNFRANALEHKDVCTQRTTECVEYAEDDVHRADDGCDYVVVGVHVTLFHLGTVRRSQTGDDPQRAVVSWRHQGVWLSATRHCDPAITRNTHLFKV